MEVYFKLNDLLSNILFLKGNIEKRYSAFEMWKHHYQASKNYNLLVEELKKVANEK